MSTSLLPVFAVATAAATVILASFSAAAAFILLSVLIALFAFEFVPYSDVDPTEEVRSIFMSSNQDSR